MRAFPTLLLLGLLACPSPDEPSPLLDVTETTSWTLDGLDGPVHVIRTAGNVPHIYAQNDVDLARVHGFVMAQDRYFELDMARRLSLGEVSELLGDAALDLDIESRQSGMTVIAERIRDNLTEEQRAIFEAYAAGVNDYIEAVRNSRALPPSEYELAASLLGVDAPIDLMASFDLRSMAGIFATLVFELGYETGDVGRHRDFLAQDDRYGADTPLRELRTAGLFPDVWESIEPVWDVASAPDGWGVNGETTGASWSDASDATGRVPRLPPALLDRLEERLEAGERRRGHDHESGFGSNAWALAGSVTEDGRAILASDGHLPLTVPSLFTQIGFDTRHLGEESGIQQVGLVVPGFPHLAVGTNGNVAWGQTQLFGDITDWYAEELQLDASGAPSASRFQGAWQPLAASEMSFEIRDVPFLGSEGRTETWTRWTTFDGRWIADIEGRSVSSDEVLADGEMLVRFGSDFIVPGDTDGDGIVSAVSFDYVGLDIGNLPLMLDTWGRAANVEEVRLGARRATAYSQNIIAADASGSVLYTGYQTVPCRTYLARNADGSWADGADPSMLLDGTTYGGFSIPLTDDYEVDESQADDPYRCVVPFADYPQAVDPQQGYVLTANNDPAGITFDSTMNDEPWYIGGPWLEGYRAETIDEVLAEEAAAGIGTIESTVTLQGNHFSRLGWQLLPELLEALDRARTAASGSPDPDTPDARLAALYSADSEAIEEAYDRLSDWDARGLQAESGVETFYASPSPDDVEDAVATMIFNAWVGRYMSRAIGDEGFRGLGHPTGDSGKTRLLDRMLASRGAGNPAGMASWNPDTEESAYWDDLSTSDTIETSPEIAVRAFVDALSFLRSAPTAPGEGGFGTDDMSAWLWGLRHRVRFDSVLGEFLGNDDSFAFLTDTFAITPDRLPLAESMDFDDPRRDLDGFPRNADHLAVDAANTGFREARFTYGSGPVFRMVIALGPDGPEGVNVIPGGQSGLTSSPYFDDQAALWLGNQALPIQWTVDEVIAAATGRETFLPAE